MTSPDQISPSSRRTGSSRRPPSSAPARTSRAPPSSSDRARCRARPEEFWAEIAARAALVHAVGARCSTGSRRSPSGSSAARTNLSLQLPRPPPRRPGAATRRRSSGRASPATAACSPTAELHREVCRFANVLKRPRRQAGRPRRHLHADDPRGRDRDARLRAHRRDAQRRLRRLLRRGAARPHQRRAGEASSSPPTAATGAARSCRSRRTSTTRSPRRPSVENVVVVRRTGETVPMKGGRDHWWHELMDEADDRLPAPSRSTPSTRSSSSTPAARPASRRASCTPPAATWCTPTSPASGSSTSRTRTPTGAPPTSAG